MFKVGDTGVTRDGRRYEVTEVEEGGDTTWPVYARVEDDAETECYTATGRFYDAGNDCDWDLMPPTGGVTTLTPEQLAACRCAGSPPADHEVLVELSGRVLVALVREMRGEPWGEGVLAKRAVAEARALLRECEA